MTPRPIHRWPSFWLGVFILTFLGWAWLDSCRHSTSYVAVDTWDNSVAIPQGVWHEDSALKFSIVRHPGPIIATATSKGVFQYSRVPNTGPPQLSPLHWRTFPPYTSVRGARLAQLSIELPHWLIILLVLIPSTTFLTWRWLLMQRLAEANAALQEIQRDSTP